MTFMLLMIPNVYRGNKKLDPGFVPDPKKVEEMARYNDELGKAVKILSLNGLHPLHTAARVSFGKGKPMVTDGPFIETTEVLGGYWMVEADSKEELVKWAQSIANINGCIAKGPWKGPARPSLRSSSSSRAWRRGPRRSAVSPSPASALHRETVSDPGFALAGAAAGWQDPLPRPPEPGSRGARALTCP